MIVSYRTGPVLFQAVAALRADPAVGEVTVVDNGNDSGTLAQLAALAADEPRLRLLTGHGNVGFAAGCNLGARACTGRFLLLINPDCIVPPGTLAGLLQAMRRFPGVALCSPRLVTPDGRPQRGTPRNTLTPWIALVETLRLDRLAASHPYFQRLNLHDSAEFAAAAPVPAVSGAFMLMPRATYERFGGLDERYFLHMEDLDLCLRLTRARQTILFVPEFTAVHHGSTSRAPFWFLEWHKARGAHLYFARHFRDFYPPAFLAAVNALVYARFALRLAARALMPWRWRGGTWQHALTLRSGWRG